MVFHTLRSKKNGPFEPEWLTNDFIPQKAMILLAWTNELFFWNCVVVRTCNCSIGLISDSDYRGEESIGLVGVKWFFKTAKNNPWYDKLTFYGLLALCADNVYYYSKH